MWVAPEARRSGVCQVLIDAVAEWGAGWGARRIVLLYRRHRRMTDNLMGLILIRRLKVQGFIIVAVYKMHPPTVIPESLP